ncbi:MAG: DUF4156 domain-containing protein [Gammaproteobacteria bacterium]
MKRSFFYTLFTVSITGVLAGCASTPLVPGAENVKLINHSAPKGCEMRGPVRSQDISGVSTSYTSHENLQVMQLNSLRNDALKLGANVIVLTQHKTASGPEYYSVGQGKITTNPLEINHSMQGEAYQCPSNIVNRLNAANFSTISDVKK